MDHGIYIHVPFCRRKCDYCSFYSIPVRQGGECADDLFNAYCGRLALDIKERFAALGQVAADTVYFGGGTPSLMGARRITALLDILREEIDIRPGAEITLEVNPEDALQENLAAMREGGVNRMILGVQTLQESLHARIGRSGPLCTGEVLDRFFSLEGVVRSADLICGIPGQDRDMLIEDLDGLTRYSPSHISPYLLSIDRGTRLFERELPDDTLQELQREHLLFTRTHLTEMGYVHYEISNYAMPGYESRHNMKYWTFLPYIGFGPGSHSFYSGERFINSMSVREYIESDRVSLERDIRDSSSRVTEYILTGLRLMRGFSIERMEERLEMPMPGPVYSRIMKAFEDGLVTVIREGGNTVVSLTEKGLCIADRVIYNVVEDILP